MFKELVTDVFFDLDHTLWDFDKNSELTFRKILAANGLQVEIGRFLEVYMPINMEYWRQYREDKISPAELRYLRLKTTLKRLGLSAPDELIHRLAGEYINSLSTFNHLLPYTIEILDYLKPKYRLHIITNGFEEIQHKKLRGANILNYFDQVINSEMAGVKKPNPKIFEFALSRSGADPQKSLMIGDSLEADILGAKAAGFHALHYNVHKEPHHSYCKMISGLHEIKMYL